MTTSTANLFIVAAPSGAGKSSLISALLQRAQEGHLLNAAQLSVSHTTRSPREGEIDGEHYHFITQAEFEHMITQDAFYEYAKVFENYYGTSKEAINDTLALGIDVFLDIDWQGAAQIRASDRYQGHVTSIFVMPPSLVELKRRLEGRATDDSAAISRRFALAQAEMSHKDEYDHIVVNDDIRRAYDDFRQIYVSQSISARAV